jgi:hypothetical protein
MAIMTKYGIIRRLHLALRMNAPPELPGNFKGARTAFAM